MWPHLSRRQRAAFLVYHCPRGSLANALLTTALHVLALTYLLAASMVFGRLAARHILPLRLNILLKQGAIELPAHVQL